MKRKLLYQIIVSLLFISIAQQFNSCKKVDLERTALVKTNSVTDVMANSATVSGTIVDLGKGPVTEYGFVYSTADNPTVENTTVKVTLPAKLGNFSAPITGLSSSTHYFVRSYLKSGDDVIYAYSSSPFTTEATNPLNTWLNFDDGANFDGLGLTEGGDFDVAIRFSPALLADYDGWKITKIKFFPKVGLSVLYSLEIYEGADINSLSLQYLEEVINPTINAWNEITLNEPFTINAANELLVGYWVQNSSAGDYPAGCDAGPADAEYGDLISVDDGTTWYSLSIAAPALNYNWNIQVYVTNQKGVVKTLTLQPKPVPQKKSSASGNIKIAALSSLNQSFNK